MVAKCGNGRTLTSSRLSSTNIQHTLLLPAFNEQLSFGHCLLWHFLHMRRPPWIDADLINMRLQQNDQVQVA
jgi:hypothetical protein